MRLYLTAFICTSPEKGNAVGFACLFASLSLVLSYLSGFLASLELAKIPGIISYSCNLSSELE